MAKFIPENIQTLLSKFTFDMETDCINEDLTCTICKKLLYDVYQSTCECKYCRKCIVSYINDGNEYCPGGKEECREELLVLEESVFQNAVLNKKVLKVKVRCPNESCQFASTLTQMDDHLRVCSLQPIECPYTKIGCANVNVNGDSVEIHLNKDILGHSQMLMEVVDNLKNEVGGLKEELRVNKLAISSLREEGKLKEREMLEEERTMGQVERGALAAVVVGLMGEVAALRGQVKCAENQQRLTKLEEEVKELRGEIEMEREKTMKMSGEIEVLKKDIEIERNESWKMRGDIEALKMEIEIERKDSRKMKGQIEVLQGDVKKKNKKKNEEEIVGIIDRRIDGLTKTVDCLSKWINKGDAVGSLWLKVDGMSELWNKGGTIFSPHFYSHINGYKLQIRMNIISSLCISGNFFGSSSSGGYIEVYSVMVKGEYDDWLSWPARGLSVSVTLINHHTKETYKTVTIKCDQYGAKSIGKDNEPFGRSLFVKNVLANHSDLVITPGIIVSDSLLLFVAASLT